jgi:hypothetical protein
MSIVSEKDAKQLLEEALDPKKVTLTCGIHHWAYGSKRKPNFRCKRCLFTMFMGLIANTPPEKRKEQVEMLEWTIHQLIEAKDKKELQQFFKHPEVYVNDKRINDKVN